MKNVRYAAYLLVAVSLLQVGLLFLTKRLSSNATELQIRYIELSDWSQEIMIFQDSLMHNPEYRKRTLGSGLSTFDFDSALASNKATAALVVEEAEAILRDRDRLLQNLSIVDKVDQVFEILTGLAVVLVIYYWRKKS